jgi:hypothetical protein
MAFSNFRGASSNFGINWVLYAMFALHCRIQTGARATSLGWGQALSLNRRRRGVVADDAANTTPITARFEWPGLRPIPNWKPRRQVRARRDVRGD